VYIGGILGRGESEARPVLPKAPLVFKYATLQNLTLDELWPRARTPNELSIQNSLKLSRLMY
jgi:hypothetical protein